MSTWASRNRTAVISVVVVIAALLGLLIGTLALTNPGSGSTAATAAPGTIEQSPTPTPDTPALSPEEQATADIEAAYRAWSTAIDHAWRTGGDPVAAAAPYVGGQFALDTAKGMRDYQDAGFVITGGAEELQRFAVTSLDLAATPPTATADYCYRDTSQYILNGQPGAMDSIRYGTDRSEQQNGSWVIVENIESRGVEPASTSEFTC